ncbi:MAG: alpha/beta fold hydrolase, partial [Pseudomonadota bacterium]
MSANHAVPARRTAQASFDPPMLLRNPHVQTLFANKPFRSPAGPEVHDGTYELPDGDVVRLVRSKGAAIGSARVIVLHGLAGGYDSAYARDLFSTFDRVGLEGHLLHFRGCGGVLNRLPRGYHAGDTADLQHYVQHLRAEAPDRGVMAVGFSLGANVLLKYLGETGSASGLDGAVAVSVPFLLADACESISRGFSLLYHKVLLHRLKVLIRSKFEASEAFAAAAPFSREEVEALRDLRAFDDLVTAPMHGFGNAERYYAHASCRQYLRGICTPTRVLHARDDPFQSAEGIPGPDELSEAI